MATLSISDIPQTGSWFALQVRPQHEKVVATLLEHKSYRCLLPVQRVRRTWSDRISQLELPLFRGYVFCEFDRNDRRVPVLSTPGVIRVVGFGKSPQPLDDAEISAIRTVMDSGVAAAPCKYLCTGTRVRIEAGPLAGLEGIVVRQKNQARLVISVSMLQRSVAIEMDTAGLTSVRAPAFEEPVSIPSFR